MRTLTAAFAVLAFATAALAEPTAVTVRATAKDAKFIGDAMGGVEITLTDAKSGKVLAKGLTAGGTGDTAKLVTGPRLRGQPLATSGAAAFNATLDLVKPTLIEATARGPMGKPDAVVTARSQMWVLPGKAIGGDGWLIELPGLVVEPAIATQGGVTVTAKVTLMCGCPIAPNSTWDAAHYEVLATLMQGDKVISTTPLAYAGQPSTFSVSLGDVAKGRYRLVLTAHDAATGNTGVTERPLTVG